MFVKKNEVLWACTQEMSSVSGHLKVPVILRAPNGSQ